MNIENNNGLINCIGLSMLLTFLKVYNDISIGWALVFLPIWGPPLAYLFICIIFHYRNKRK